MLCAGYLLTFQINSATMIMEANFSSEISVRIYNSATRHFPE